MRLPILVYGVLYVVVEMVGHSLRTVGWHRITPLDVAAALVDALLAIVLAIALVVIADISRRRWLPALRAWQDRRIAADETAREAIGVASWRAGEDPGAPAHPLGTGAGGTYRTPSARVLPDGPGRLL